MRRVLFAALRVCLATSVCLIALAIAIGRQYKETPESREAAPPRFQLISGHLFEDLAPGLGRLDVETGTLERVRLPGRGMVEHAAVSPWRDGQGRTHVAGLWAAPAGRRDEEPATALARFAVPGWEMLDRVEVDAAPASPLCWLPDRTSRIIYAGGDGRLYRFSFDDPAEGPQPIAWTVRPPEGLITVATPSWPADSRLAGKLLASVCAATRSAPPRVDGEATCQERLWWLRLSADHSAIEAGGPLIRPSADASSAPLAEERFPTVASGADGGLVLAYLARRQSSEPSYRLRLAPLAVEGDGRPRVEAAEVIELPGERVHAPAAFSTDGRWIHSTVRGAGGPVRSERLSVAEALGTRQSGPSAARSLIARAPGDRQPGEPARTVAADATPPSGATSIASAEERSAIRLTTTARDSRVAQ